MKFKVKCKIPFGIISGKIVVDNNNLFEKDKLYDAIVENFKNYKGSYKCIWIKYKDSDTYGPGVRLMFEGNSNDWIKEHYAEYFYSIEQTKRDLKLEKLIQNG